ncbi:hypothetical protein BCM02_11471 [Paenibacillus methanolicus]|uniref:Uncharacterized protein n=1 Tax=Paenibacillus methanolicus TaxID=582686 RepID=A0A5S5BQR9_9BACL|nr:hypothetical protein BCM02_11471 [Paenibacillus methanolicus]
MKLCPTGQKRAPLKPTRQPRIMVTARRRESRGQSPLEPPRRRRWEEGATKVGSKGRSPLNLTALQRRGKGEGAIKVGSKGRSPLNLQRAPKRGREARGEEAGRFMRRGACVEARSGWSGEYPGGGGGEPDSEGSRVRVLCGRTDAEDERRRTDASGRSGESAFVISLRLV